MLRSTGKQSGESVESVLKKKRKTTVGRIYTCFCSVTLYAALTEAARIIRAAGFTNGRASVCPSVRLSRQSTAATAAGGFAAERRAGRRYRSVAAGAVLQAPALSSKCGHRRVESQRRRINSSCMDVNYGRASTGIRGRYTASK